MSKDEIVYVYTSNNPDEQPVLLRMSDIEDVMNDEEVDEEEALAILLERETEDFYAD